MEAASDRERAGQTIHIVEFLNAEVATILAMPEVREFLARQGAFVATSTPAEFSDRVKADMDKWREVVRISGMRPD